MKRGQAYNQKSKKQKKMLNNFMRLQKKPTSFSKKRNFKKRGIYRNKSTNRL
jgi:hypothetical protein